MGPPDSTGRIRRTSMFPRVDQWLPSRVPSPRDLPCCFPTALCGGRLAFLKHLRAATSNPDPSVSLYPVPTWRRCLYRHWRPPAIPWRRDVRPAPLAVLSVPLACCVATHAMYNSASPELVARTVLIFAPTAKSVLTIPSVFPMDTLFRVPKSPAQSLCRATVKRPGAAYHTNVIPVSGHPLTSLAGSALELLPAVDSRTCRCAHSVLYIWPVHSTIAQPGHCDSVHTRLVWFQLTMQ